MDYSSPQRRQYFYYTNTSPLPKAGRRVDRNFDQQASEFQAITFTRPNRPQQAFTRPVRPHERDLQPSTSPGTSGRTDYIARERVGHKEPVAAMDYNAAYSKFLAVNANWKTQHSAAEQAVTSEQPVVEAERDTEAHRAGPVQANFDQKQNRTLAAAALSATNMYSQGAVTSSETTAVTRDAEEATINPQLLSLDTTVPDEVQDTSAPAVSAVSLANDAGQSVDHSGQSIEKPEYVADDEESMFVPQWSDDGTECQDSPRSEVTVIAPVQSQPANRASGPVSHVYPDHHAEDQENRIGTASHMGGSLPQHEAFGYPRPEQVTHRPEQVAYRPEQATYRPGNYLLQNRGDSSNERFQEGSVQQGNFNAAAASPASTMATSGYSRAVAQDFTQANSFSYGDQRTESQGFDGSQLTRISRNVGVSSLVNNYDAEDDMDGGQQHFYHQGQQAHADTFASGRPQSPPPRPMTRLAHRHAASQYQASPTVPPPRPTAPVPAQTFKEGSFFQTHEEQARAHAEQQRRQQLHARIQMEERAQAQAYFQNQKMFTQTQHAPSHVQQAHMQTPYMATQDSQMPVQTPSAPSHAQPMHSAQAETDRQHPQAAHSRQLQLGDEQHRELVDNHSQLQQHLFGQLEDLQREHLRESVRIRRLIQRTKFEREWDEKQQAVIKARDEQIAWCAQIEASLRQREENRAAQLAYEASRHEPSWSTQMPQSAQFPNPGPHYLGQTTQFAHGHPPPVVQTRPPPREKQVPVPTIHLIESTPEKARSKKARIVPKQTFSAGTYLTVEPRRQVTEPRLQATEPRIASQEPWANDHVFYNSPTMTIGHPSRAPEHLSTANYQQQPVPAVMDHLQPPVAQTQFSASNEPWYGHHEAAVSGTQGGYEASPAAYSQTVASPYAPMAPDMVNTQAGYRQDGYTQAGYTQAGYTQASYGQNDDPSPYYFEQR